MSVLDEANRLAAAGQQQAAVALVREAAHKGDAEALFAVANWRIFGLYGPRDFAEAHRLLDRAVEQGDVEAIRLKAILIGNGTGVPADLEASAAMLESIRSKDPAAAAQLDLAARMARDEDADALPRETLSTAPRIEAVRTALSAGECAYLIALAEPELQPSFVINPSTGGRMPHPIRTSMGMNFGPTLEDRVVHLINRRLARLTGTQVDWGEPLNVLRYAPGQEYRPHTDALPGVANQRQCTALVYLNEGYEGGATRFDKLGFEFRGAIGDALLFWNVDERGEPDDRTLHTGMPVTGGVKWLASRWIRQSTFTLDDSR